MLILGPLWTTKGVYNPKAFFPHAASLDQAFAHCPRFPVAATRRCMDRVSVPLWLADLSAQLLVIALVSLYPTNKLIRRRPLLRRAVKPFSQSFTLRNSKSQTLNPKPSFALKSYGWASKLPAPRSFSVVEFRN